jgi:hypothetical protein
LRDKLDGEVLQAIDDAQIDILSILQPLDGQASQFPKDWRAASPWLIPRFGRPRPTARRLHGCEGLVPELLMADEACRKRSADSKCYKVALITSACYLCNTRWKTRSIGRF